MASTTSNDPVKRKNDEPAPRRPQWLLLVIGIIIGILLMLIVMQGRGSSTITVQNALPEGIELTATSIIEGATATAQAIMGASGNSNMVLDPVAMTVTAISASGSLNGVDPIMVTATALVIEATQRAQTPSS